MTSDSLRPGSLALHRNRPVLVTRVGDKLELLEEDGSTARVRPKDVALLHPGPIESWGELRSVDGDVDTARELLAGQTTTLEELAELAYGAFTPSTAWATWQLVSNGLYFRGDVSEIVVATPEEVEARTLQRAAQEAERAAWLSFVERVHAGGCVPADARYLMDVEMLARGEVDRSRVMKELGFEESPESAHALLLQTGYWDWHINPYPIRADLPLTTPPRYTSGLPDETRRDLTHLTAFAIDDGGTELPDDAVSLDGRRLWVHVADVAAVVSPDDAIDLEARGRGAALYLPEQEVPMLPLELTPILGLGLREVSPALSFGMDLDAEGAVEALEIVPSMVRVTRLTYDEAATRLDEEPLKSIYRIAQSYHAKRVAADAVMMDMPEVKIWVADDGVHIIPLPSLPSRVLVEEAMVMTGEAVAQYAIRENLPIPFTTQEVVNGGPPPETLSEMYAVRKTMRRSQYRSTPGPHMGLGLHAYVQCTSPLRRYLDLIVHQQLRAHLRGAEPITQEGILERVAMADVATGAIRRCEFLSNQHWTLGYLLQHPDWRGEGVVVELRGHNARVIIPELALEPQVHLAGNGALDALLTLAVSSIDLPRLTATFRVL